MGGFDRTNGLDDLFLKWNFTSVDRLYGLHYSEINRGSWISAFCQDYRGWKFCFFFVQTFCFLILFPQVFPVSCLLISLLCRIFSLPLHCVTSKVQMWRRRSRNGFSLNFSFLVPLPSLYLSIIVRVRLLSNSS